MPQDGRMERELELSAVLDRLEAAGFTERLVVDGAMLRAVASGERFDPTALAVVEIRRFEGANDPDDAAVLVAVTTAAGEPVGTYTAPYGPATSAEDAAVIDRLHEPPLSEEDISAHHQHDHIAALFPTQDSAEAAVDDLRQLGLGSAQLGVAVHAGDRVAFERDAEAELERDVAVGVGSGVIVGFLAGFALVGLAVPVLGTVGVGGLLALGAASGLGGGMLGGYLGVGVGDASFEAHEHLTAAALQPGEVLLVVCSHGHPDVVQQTMERHGGRLRPAAAT
jgi:hypothetical protein